MPIEYNDTDYVHEVLQLSVGQSETFAQDALVREAESWGITIPCHEVAKNKAATDNSVTDSAASHNRSASTESRRSQSTGMTSRSSLDRHSFPDGAQSRRRPYSGRSPSFTEYDKFLLQSEAMDIINRKISIPAIPPEPTPSLFSVSRRKSYASIKRGLKSKFRLRRVNTSEENVK